MAVLLENGNIGIMKPVYDGPLMGDIPVEIAPLDPDYEKYIPSVFSQRDRQRAKEILEQAREGRHMKTAL